MNNCIAPNDHYVFITQSEKGFSFKEHELVYQVIDFDCGLSAATDDFRDLLDCQAHPKIKLRIAKIQPNQADQTNRKSVTAYVRVTVAGVEQA